MLADQKDNVQRTGLMGFRVVVSKERACKWIDKDCQSSEGALMNILYICDTVLWIQSDPDEEIKIPVSEKESRIVRTSSL